MLMSDLDLNLLSVFDALYELRSVTQVAQRLNVTQSAVSHALRRLRLALGDPLFVRAHGSLQPSARAREVAPGIREGLGRLRSALAPVGFDPPSATRAFTVAAGSYFCALLIPELVARARAVAPGVTFRVIPVGADLLADLDDGSVELALGAFADVPARLTVQPLFREDLVWVAAAGNPIAGAPITSPDALLRQPRVTIATTRPFEPSRALLSESALEPRIGTDRLDAAGASGTVYDALTAAAVVARTDMIALVPRRIARINEERLGIAILDADEHGSGIDLAMLSHVRSRDDAGLDWLRAQIVDLTS